MMTPFREMNRLVNDLFAKHSPGPAQTLFGDACLAFRAERTALLEAHGWEPEHFTDKVDEYASDHEACE